MDHKTVGENIRRMRNARGLTLDKTALSAGLTKSTLSKIENGLVSPPISTVMRIGEALSVSLSDLFLERKNRPHYLLTRKGEGNHIVQDGSQFGYSYEALVATMSDKRGDPFILTIKPTDPQGEFRHGGEEFVYVISGALELTIDLDVLVLRTGDSLYFANPRLIHKTRALGKTPARVLVLFMHLASDDVAGLPVSRGPKIKRQKMKD